MDRKVGSIISRLRIREIPIPSSPYLRWRKQIYNIYKNKYVDIVSFAELENIIHEKWISMSYKERESYYTVYYKEMMEYYRKQSVGKDYSGCYKVGIMEPESSYPRWRNKIYDIQRTKYPYITTGQLEIIIATKWNSLSYEEKEPYNTEYYKEMIEYYRKRKILCEK